MKNKSYLLLVLILTLTILPARAQLFKKLKGEISSLGSKDLAEYYKSDQGITSTAHENHIGEIVFSEKKLALNDFSETDFANEITLGNPVYFRAFFPKSMYNMAVDHYKSDMINLGDIGITVKYLINDELKFSKFQPTLSDIDFNAMKSWTTFQGVLSHPTEDYQILQWTFKDFMIAHPDFFEGDKTYRLGIELVLATEDEELNTIATGSINVNQTSEGLQKLYNSSGIGLPERKTVNIDLENDILQTLTQHAEDNGWKESYKNILITSRDWTILRHEETGEILGRVREIAATGTWPNGECQYKYYDIFQNYIGSEFTGKLSIKNIGGGYTIPCKILE